MNYIIKTITISFMSILLSSVSYAAVVFQDNNGSIIDGVDGVLVAEYELNLGAGLHQFDVSSTDFDTQIYLFDAGRNLVGGNDDNFGVTGLSFSDSSYTQNLLAGTYYLTVGPSFHDSSEAEAGGIFGLYYSNVSFFGADPEQGNFSLTVDGPAVAAVPVPAALPLFASSLFCLSLFRRKRA